MEDGCNETCSGVVALGSWYKEEDTVGKAMSFSLRCAASIVDDDW